MMTLRARLLDLIAPLLSLIDRFVKSSCDDGEDPGYVPEHPSDVLPSTGEMHEDEDASDPARKGELPQDFGGGLPA